jgi:hypothetical protein
MHTESFVRGITHAKRCFAGLRGAKRHLQQAVYLTAGRAGFKRRRDLTV